MDEQTDGYIGSDVGTYLGEVSNIKQVKGLEQLTLFEMKPVLTNSQERSDVLQAQELNRNVNTAVTLVLEQMYIFNKMVWTDLMMTCNT